MSYATEDFSESLSRVGIAREEVAAVEAAWGSGEGMGIDAGHYHWSAEGVTDWSGGFLMRLLDGSYAYVTGWCDYTGWGCQDGAEVHRFTERPLLETLKAHSAIEGNAPDAEHWDIEPADLNRWLTTDAHAVTE